MPIYEFGSLIRRRRMLLGYTQEDLADGICSVPTLSRIENGERMPTKEHFEMLLQRLGYSDAVACAYVDEHTLVMHELKFQIRQTLILGRREQAKELLKTFEEGMEKGGTPVERQFVLLCSTVLEESAFTPEQRLERFETALRLTCPGYAEDRFPLALSYEEILIMNNIAGCYAARSDYDRAIDLLQRLKRYYEEHMVSTEEILRTQPLILYNLSTCLGQAGRYEECISICDLGIRVARETGRCSVLGRMLYNRAWALVRRKGAGDLLAARESAVMAYDMARIMEQKDSMEHYRRFLEQNFPGQTLL